MPHFLKVLVVSLFVVIGISACSSTEETTTQPEAPTSDIPTWFVPSGFSSDSLSFYGYADAIETDSTIAVANARLQAKANLETALAKELESVREELEAEGKQVVSQPDFLISLRNAHQSIQDEAEAMNGKALDKDGHYLGYAQVTITKNDVEELIRSGLSNNENYRTVFVESAAFQAFLQ